ncbi:Gnk2-homologous domain-containing protein [Artemisia annua]|uniref:Gnk2-homologous domain-containing protein n=1 Tax=Artemisia annua TaxID=35608 RepID=A0A2U1Q1F0_ARTAN|nr:Gnk2-homologous domain-containing protein [Artemisia annua]
MALLFFFFLLASVTTSTTADLTIPAIDKTCTNQTLQDPTTNITLDTLFTTLVAESNLTNFFQTNIITTATTVNGLYQCLADLSQTDCKTCVQKLTNIIKKPCKNATHNLQDVT